VLRAERDGTVEENSRDRGGYAAVDALILELRSNETVIASAAKAIQFSPSKSWIASSASLLAMTTNIKDFHHGLSKTPRHIAFDPVGLVLRSSGSVYDATSIRIAADLGLRSACSADRWPRCAVLAIRRHADHLLKLSEPMRRCPGAAALPVLVDADHGYGNASMSTALVQELERRGGRSHHRGYLVAAGLWAKRRRN